MSTVTVRLPDDVADRLKTVAQSRGVSIDKLMTEVSLQTLASYDAETRFRAAAAQADIPAALAVLERLDEEFSADAEYPTLER
jgi:predicted transcriptional regulator